MQLKPKDIGKLFKSAYKAWNDKDPFRQSAVIAYYAIFSIPGLLVLIIAITGYFFGKDAVLKLIDEMSRYKFNVFHWHLTDDQGWRLEIKNLRNLTQTGAWRVPRTGGKFEYLEKPGPGEKATDGGFYTQKDIIEIVAYASRHFITVIPEIDVPAHSLAFIASYPNISCKQLPMFVSPGSPLTDSDDNVLCVANDSTYILLDKIFTEVAELFPGKYVHIGGDEAAPIFWDSCSKCKKLKDQFGLKTSADLQAYFMQKVSGLLKTKGKDIIGWEEIMHGTLAPGAIVESWTSVVAGIKAARLKHYVIMSPWDHGFYMDHSKLETVYNFEPLPVNMDAAYLLGGEACLWTEQVPTFREAEKHYWPQALVLSEMFWTSAQSKNFSGFQKRMIKSLEYFDKKQINYSTRIFDPIITLAGDQAAQKQIAIKSEFDSEVFYYSFDNTEPDHYSSRYTGEFLRIPKGATQLKVRGYQDEKPVGKLILKNLAADSLADLRLPDVFDQ